MEKLIVENKHGQFLELTCKDFDRTVADLPCANIKYGFDRCTVKEFTREGENDRFVGAKGVDKYSANDYPTTCTVGKYAKYKGKNIKVIQSYQLPYRDCTVKVIDTERPRELTIVHVLHPAYKDDSIGNSIYPLFAICENGKHVAYLQGESYHKD